MLQMSQWVLDWEEDVAGRGNASAGGGAEYVVRGGIERVPLVTLEVLSLGLDCGSTIERYLSAIVVPDGVEDGRAGAVVFNSCSEERTKGTRLRRIPAPKMRWSSSGRK